MELTILGAGGFIGSHMVEHFIKTGEHQIVGVDINAEKLTGITGKNFEYRHIDVVKNNNLIDKTIRYSDVVVDLIAYANPSRYITSPLKVFELNFIQNIKVVNMCVKYGKKLFQYSSAEVYGKQERGNMYFEDTTDSVFGPVKNQRWIYATAKLLLERVIHAHGLAGDLEYTIIRPFNFIGSRYDYLVAPKTMGGPRVFAHFMSALLSGGPMYLVNGGRVHRTFLSIKDANRGFQTLLDHPEESYNEIFNLGNPKNNVTIHDFALLMKELYEELTDEAPKSELLNVSGEEFYGKGYEDSDRLPPDIQKIRSLGWEPQYDLRTTLIDSMIYYLDRAQKGSINFRQPD